MKLPKILAHLMGLFLCCFSGSSWSQKKIPVSKAKDSVSTPQLSLEKKSQVFVVDSSQSLVTLRMSHNVLGRFDTLARNALRGHIEVGQSGEVKAKTLEFVVDQLSSLIGLRDRHMKEDFLESKKFPLIFLRNGASTLIRTVTPPKEGAEFSGLLTVKQIESKVKGQSFLRIEDDLLIGRVEFSTRLSEFKISPPSYMGVGVKDEVNVISEITARPDLSDIEDPDLSSSDF